MKYGIDCSHHQGWINWKAVKRDGKDFCIMKCIYESSRKPDEFFERNYKGCVENNILPGIYVYHARQSAASPDGEASAVLKVLNKRPLPYFIWLDLEDKNLRTMGQSAIDQIISVETKIFRDAGYKVGIYCNKDWYDNVIDTRWRSQFRFWIARYPLNDVGEMDERLSPMAYAAAWQYSSKGKVNGISGNVDMDVDFIDIPNSSEREYKPGMKIVTANNLNLRLRPSKDSADIGDLPKGTQVLVDKVSGKWGHVEGWLSLDYTE